MDLLAIEELPIEMILEIFSYLCLSSLKNASLVCHKWYEAICYPKTINRMLLVMNKSNYDKYKHIKKRRPIHNIKFSAMNIYKEHENMELWLKLGHNWHFVIFRYCQLSIKQFIGILQATKNLQTLKIEDCYFTDLLENILEVNDSLKDVLKTVTKFKFKRIDSNNIKLFIILAEMMPQLQSLEVDRFQWANETIYNSLKLRATTLRKLCIHREASETFFEEFLQNQNLHLEELKLNIELTQNLIKKIIYNQKFITTLYLYEGVSNPQLVTICNHMPNLKVLNLAYYYYLGDEGIKELWKLQKLTFLNISGGIATTANGFMVGLKEKNDNLQSLNITLMNSGENLLEHIANKFINLRELDFGCISGIKEMDIQCVWKNLCWLRKFTLSCNHVTISDFSYTGKLIEADNHESNGYSIARVKGLRHLKILPQHIISMETLIEIAKLKELVSVILPCGQSKLEIEELQVLSNCKLLEELDVTLENKPITRTRRKALRKHFRRVKIFSVKKGLEIV